MIEYSNLNIFHKNKEKSNDDCLSELNDRNKFAIKRVHHKANKKELIGRGMFLQKEEIKQ